ncbi:capsid cement protein [Geomicrobium sediminis]|uniref:Uncharacterized protein n=1 Tax=Geomicrobium sediminis TaxID=1347788 RepID=A0ABS2PEZ9_9BACL|nr:capsid cement protein [Geomicrobium sediminis]MBM7633837.1 hypothetical protein [Geomicrobium sediminis]
MDVKGRPYPTTRHYDQRAKVSDGQSVRVKIPEGKDIVPQNLYLIDGFLGFATGQDDLAGELILTVERAEFETNQVKPDTEYSLGDQVYFDQTDEVLTKEPNDRFAGIVTNPLDSKGNIWFILFNQGSQTSGGSGVSQQAFDALKEEVEQLKQQVDGGGE